MFEREEWWEQVGWVYPLFPNTYLYNKKSVKQTYCLVYLGMSKLNNTYLGVPTFVSLYRTYSDFPCYY